MAHSHRNSGKDRPPCLLSVSAFGPRGIILSVYDFTLSPRPEALSTEPIPETRNPTPQPNPPFQVRWHTVIECVGLVPQIRTLKPEQYPIHRVPSTLNPKPCTRQPTLSTRNPKLNPPLPGEDMAHSDRVCGSRPVLPRAYPMRLPGTHSEPQNKSD